MEHSRRAITTQLHNASSQCAEAPCITKWRLRNACSCETSTSQAGLETTSGHGQREPGHPYGHSVAPCESAQPSIFVGPLANRPSSVDCSAETVSNEYEGRPLEFVTAGMAYSSPLEILQQHHIWRHLERTAQQLQT